MADPMRAISLWQPWATGDLGPTVALPQSITAPGNRGFWTVDPAVAERIRAAAPWPWDVLRMDRAAYAAATVEVDHG